MVPAHFHVRKRKEKQQIMSYLFSNSEGHRFLRTTDNPVICQLCGGHEGNHTKKEAIPQSSMDQIMAEFPELLERVMKQKQLEQIRTDIARMTSALIINGKEWSTAVDTACYLYERIVRETEGWVK